MHRISRFIASVAASALLVVPSTAFAGKLDNFESSLNQPTKTYDSGSYSDSDSESFFLDIFGEIMVDLLAYGMVYGGVSSMERVNGGISGPDAMEIESRENGEPLIPFARIDVAYLDAESDVKGYDYRLECGYGAFAVHLNHTHYRESSPKDKLDLIRLYGIYRMSFGSHFELGLGLGSLTVKGNDSNSRMSFTMPIRIQPGEHIGIEFRPSWAENLNERDLGVLLRWEYVSLKAGYRWVSSFGESLDSAYVGFSVHY